MKNRTENNERKQHRSNTLLLQEIPREYTDKIFIVIYFGTRSQCVTKCVSLFRSYSLIITLFLGTLVPVIHMRV